MKRRSHTNGNYRSFEVLQEPSQGAPEGGFEPLLDSEEAAALLKIHPKTLQKLPRRGEVSAIHIGTLWRFRASALDEWLKRTS